MLADVNIIVNTMLVPVRATINDYEKNKAKRNEVAKNDREGNIGVRLRLVGSNPKNTDAGKPGSSMEWLLEEGTLHQTLLDYQKEANSEAVLLSQQLMKN